LAEKTTSVIMTAVESRYFLRINGHPPQNLAWMKLEPYWLGAREKWEFVHIKMFYTPTDIIL
jgi:hypothetical protein